MPSQILLGSSYHAVSLRPSLGKNPGEVEKPVLATVPPTAGRGGS